MEYKVYKLRFQGAVHFGRKNLEDGEYTFCADTLFSALFQEALKYGKDAENRLLQYAKSGKLLISDAFPYMGTTYYLPKPMLRIDTGNNRGDSTVKKAFKKLKYIPVEEIGNYLRGNFDVQNAADISGLGSFEMKVSAAVRGEEETLPYRVGTYYYNKGNGLYIIVGYELPEVSELVDVLLEGLALTGIGGKRASGMGKFELKVGKIPPELERRLAGQGERYMTLSVALPKEEELAAALNGAEYVLCKRSGFVDSGSYAQMQRRKRDLYVFKAGACLKTKFAGDIYDVEDGNGTHPVYRYAKPMFMEVGV